jgi:hypothetical protein
MGIGREEVPKGGRLEFQSAAVVWPRLLGRRNGPAGGDRVSWRFGHLAPEPALERRRHLLLLLCRELESEDVRDGS